MRIPLHYKKRSDEAICHSGHGCERSAHDAHPTQRDAGTGILGKAEFTVREWCRRRRIHAQKRRSGRGKFCSWVISHEELQRIQREGLLPEH